MEPEEPWQARRTKRSDGRFCLNITVENPDGTTRRVYFYGRTQAEAKAKAAAARERVGRGEPVRDATRTVSDWLAEWRTTFLRASDRAESTKDLYAGLTERHVEPLIGHLALGQVKPSDITRVLLHMEKLGRAASTRRNAYAALRSAFDDAVIDGLLAASPVLRVKRPRATHTEATSLEPEQVARLLHGARDLRYAKVLRLILGPACAAARRWHSAGQDVRLDRCELSIKGSLTRRGSELVVSDAKTQRSRRVVSLSPAMVRLITEHRAEQVAERLRAGNLWEDTGFVFATEFGSSGRPAEPAADDDDRRQAGEAAADRRAHPPSHVRHDGPAEQRADARREPQSRPLLDHDHRRHLRPPHRRRGQVSRAGGLRTPSTCDAMKALIDSMVIRLRRPIRTRARSPLPHIRQIVVRSTPSTRAASCCEMRRTGADRALM